MADLRAALEPMMANLSEDEREVLSARLGLDRNGRPRTFAEVAAILGCGEESLRATERAALERLRIDHG